MYLLVFFAKTIFPIFENHFPIRKNGEIFPHPKFNRVSPEQISFTCAPSTNIFKKVSFFNTFFSLLKIYEKN